MDWSTTGEDYLLYEILQDSIDPKGIVPKGTIKTACQWLGRFALLTRSDLDTMEDWFALRQEAVCYRCGKMVSKEWWSQMSNGQIILDVSSASLQTLWGSGYFPWLKRHPVLIVDDAQHIELKWGNGFQYKLCASCHSDLIGRIGDFFKTSEILK